MFAYIKGILEEKSSNYVVVETAGIGYKIFMGETAINTIGEINEKVKVYTHYHVREDEVSLYGFKTNEELRMFELLISVSGVGAKSALVTLSNIEPSSFALAVITNYTSKLVKIPGIGAKTAARIILELKDKLKNEQAVSKEDKDIKTVVIDNQKIEEAVSALQVLGYNKKEIEKALETIDVNSLELEEIIKQGLISLSKR